MFDVDKLTAFAIQEIEVFAKDHQHETFYGFCIDAGMLCLNSEEAFAETLDSYRKQWPSAYQSEKEIDKLRYNPGEWKYQGFAQFDTNDAAAVENGFDRDLYDEHYYAEKNEQENSAYAKAMHEMLERLMAADAFNLLKKAADFKVVRAEHNY